MGERGRRVDEQMGGCVGKTRTCPTKAMAIHGSMRARANNPSPEPNVVSQKQRVQQKRLKSVAPTTFAKFSSDRRNSPPMIFTKLSSARNSAPTIFASFPSVQNSHAIYELFEYAEFGSHDKGDKGENPRMCAHNRKDTRLYYKSATNSEPSEPQARAKADL